MHKEKKKKGGGGEVKKGPVGVVQKQTCAAQTAHKVWKVRSTLRRRTLAHVGLQRAQKSRLRPLTVSLLTHNLCYFTRLWPGLFAAQPLKVNFMSPSL